MDFFHVETALPKRLDVMVFIEHGTRRMHLGGVTANPTGQRTTQQARNLSLTLRLRGRPSRSSGCAPVPCAGSNSLR